MPKITQTAAKSSAPAAPSKSSSSSPLAAAARKASAKESAKESLAPPAIKPAAKPAAAAQPKGLVSAARSQAAKLAERRAARRATMLRTPISGISTTRLRVYGLRHGLDKFQSASWAAVRTVIGDLAHRLMVNAEALCELRRKQLLSTDTMLRAYRSVRGRELYTLGDANDSCVGAHAVMAEIREASRDTSRSAPAQA